MSSGDSAVTARIREKGGVHISADVAGYLCRKCIEICNFSLNTWNTKCSNDLMQDYDKKEQELSKTVGLVQVI